MSFRRRSSLALLMPLAGLAALGACHDRKPERPEIENESAIEEPVEPVTAAPDSEPEEEPRNVQAEVKPAPPPEFSDDQQVLDDAAAVGMTARLSRADPPSETHDPASPKGKGNDGNGSNGGNGGELGQIY